MAKGDNPFPGFTEALDVIDLNDFDLLDPRSAPAFDALGGNDRVTLSGSQALGDTPFSGGDGDDWVFGTRGGDVILGGRGRDVLFADPVGELDPTGAADLLDGGAGDDILRGGDGRATLRGGTGDDYLRCGRVEDRLFGGAGDDTLLGAAGDDALHGGAGNDVVNGGGLMVSGGRFYRDLLEGGAGADTFVFGYDSAFAVIIYHSGASGGARDRIVDFDPREGDRIELAVDADRTGGTIDDAFTFVGEIGAGDTPDPGEVGYFRSGESTIVRAETGQAFGPASGFEITLVNFDGALTAGAFIL